MKNRHDDPQTSRLCVHGKRIQIPKQTRKEDPSENTSIYTTMPFADRAAEELVGIVVVIPVRAVGIEEEEPWVFPDERVEVDVRTVLARRGELDRVGDHFLAGPGLAEKEHRFGR